MIEINDKVIYNDDLNSGSIGVVKPNGPGFHFDTSKNLNVNWIYGRSIKDNLIIEEDYVLKSKLTKIDNHLYDEYINCQAWSDEQKEVRKKIIESLEKSIKPKPKQENNYQQTNLDFYSLREANVMRCNEVFHKLDRWNPMEWGCAASGEMGELCNLLKKKYGRNEDILLSEIADEIADTIIYLDLLSARLEINLGEAIMSKFDRTSKKKKWDYPIRSFK